MLQAPISTGDLLDRISILEIKKSRLIDASRRRNVERELEILRACFQANFNETEIDKFIRSLYEVNRKLWDIEDTIRDCERGMDFGPKFIHLARSVYMTNDIRAQIKRKINELLHSDIIEEKCYSAY